MPYGLAETVFEVSTPSVIEELRKMEVEPEDGIVLISKGKCRTGGAPAG